MRTLARLLLALLLLPALAPATPARAEGFAGDLEPKPIGWFDALGKQNTTFLPGDKLSMRYTITNTLTFPVKVTGVDSEVSVGGCQASLSRASRNVDPGHVFPIYLMPGETSKVLTDEWYVMAKTATCGDVWPSWWPNALAERATTPFPRPTPTARPTPASSVASARASTLTPSAGSAPATTPTPSVTGAPTDTATPATEPVVDNAAPAGPFPWLPIGLGALAVVGGLAVLVALVRRSR